MSSQITMAVPDSNLTAQFYCDSLGMSKQRHGLGYDPAQAHLKFLSDPSVYLQKGGFYWKIGLTVPDLDRSVLHLKSQGVSVSQPRQFEDIGYMGIFWIQQAAPSSCCSRGYRPQQRQRLQ